MSIIRYAGPPLAELPKKINQARAGAQVCISVARLHRKAGDRQSAVAALELAAHHRRRLRFFKACLFSLTEGEWRGRTWREL